MTEAQITWGIISITLMVAAGEGDFAVAGAIEAAEEVEQS